MAKRRRWHDLDDSGGSPPPALVLVGEDGVSSPCYVPSPAALLQERLAAGLAPAPAPALSPRARVAILVTLAVASWGLVGGVVALLVR